MTGYSKNQQVGAHKKSQTETNQSANKQLDKLYTEKGINYCELHVSRQCLKTEKTSYGEKLQLTYVHRHKRDWYKGKPAELLYSYGQTLRGCLPCHMEIEYDKNKTEQLFLRLRGPE
jgi:ribosomal protein L28